MVQRKGGTHFRDGCPVTICAAGWESFPELLCCLKCVHKDISGPLPEAHSGLLILGQEDLAWLLNRRCGSRGKFRKDWLQPWPVFSVRPDRPRARGQLRSSCSQFLPWRWRPCFESPPVEAGFLWQTVSSVGGTFLQRRNSQPGIYCSWLFFTHHLEGRGVFIYTAFLEQFLGSFTFVGFTYSRLALIDCLFQFLQELHE